MLLGGEIILEYAGHLSVNHDQAGLLFAGLAPYFRHVDVQILRSFQKGLHTIVSCVQNLF